MIPISCSVCSLSKKVIVVHAPGRPPESVCRSSPLASPGVRRAAGTPRIPFFEGGRGWGGDLPKQKKDRALGAASSGVGEGGGRQLCVHEQFFGPGKRGKHSCVSSGSAISFQNGACRSAKKQSWSIRVIVSRPYVPATSAHQSSSETKVLWGEMVNVYSWSDGDFFYKNPWNFLGI